VKTLHFVSILVLTAATAFACNDEGDRLEGGAGSAGSAGSAGKTNAAGSAGKTGVAGTSNSGAGAGAGGGDAGSTSEGGVPGGAGANEGGAAGAAGSDAGGGAGGETSDAGGAGGAGGEGGAGGAPEVPDVLVPGPTALIGTWDTNFGGTEIITANTWSGANIVAYTNGVTVVYTHNPASDPYNPRKFSKFVYTEPVSDSFYFCQIVYNAETLAAAQADTKVTDATNPDTSGCSGFSWTKATRH
jgi:hypothetical protein